ncbi:MAG: heme ABC transporter ATP-binding protein, partial [Brachymonas sp.]|nr:heme ABC transporter ATP-binding protein [Brachymonas sp.]
VAHGPAAATLTPDLIERIWGVQCQMTQHSDGSPHLML